jgi:hypothetical protein
VVVTVQPDFPETPSLHSTLGFWSQLARTSRQYEKLAPDYDPVATSVEELDRYLFFFLCFFSLRDWLKADTPEAFNLWKQRYEGRFEWKICRDIANSFKHLDLEQPSLGDQVKLIRDFRLGDRHQISAITQEGVVPLYQVARTLWHEVGDFVREARTHLPPQGRGVAKELAAQPENYG